MTDEFPDEFFAPPKGRTADWPDHPELRLAVEWFRSFIPEKEWKQRRQAAASRLFATAGGRIEVTDKGRFFSESDTFGWYLFLAEAFLDHIWNYDPTFGSRVVPVMMAIGRNLDLLRSIERVNARVRRLVGPERRQSNGGLFELLVAAAYRRAGANVVFIAEKAQARTHDMDVTFDGKTWAVECKRMEVGEYSERERERIRRLWQPSAVNLASLRRTSFCNAQFTVPLDSVPDDYLTEKTSAWLKSADSNRLWHDAVAYGAIGDLDLEPLNAVLAEYEVLASSSRLLELLSGTYERNGSFVQVLSIQQGRSPRYIKACDLAILLKWSSRSEIAIDAKARDIFSKLVDANGQLPQDRPGIIHIGFEAVEGNSVEEARYNKIMSSTANFDPGETPLHYVFCHYLVPESPPDLSFAYEETSQWISLTEEGSPPIREMSLILPPDEISWRLGTHWKS